MTDFKGEVQEVNQITVIESSDNTAVIIVIFAVGIIIMIFLVLLARFLYNKMRREKARAEEIRITQQNLNRNGQIKVIPRDKHGMVDKNKVQNSDGNNQQANNQDDVPNQPNEDELGEIYEEQYDPNQEFRIFGIGDKTKGGIQSLQ